MTQDLNTLIQHSLLTLLQETYVRASSQGGFLLNQGEPGIVDTLKVLSAETVSRPPAPGRKPIVSHANHVLYGLELLNRAIAGDERAFPEADWEVAWQLVQVDEEAWKTLRHRLEQQVQKFIASAGEVTQWNQIMLTGSFASAAHAAYHLGAIRQMLLDLEVDRPK